MEQAFRQLADLADPAVEAFVRHTRDRAQAHGVGFVFAPTSQLAYPTSSLEVSGYFVDRPRIELGVATGKPLAAWLPIFVHESCHMDQFIDNARCWREAFCQERETVDFIDEWVNGREDLPLPIQELIRRSLAVELDCERRSVDKIRQFNLPIDVEEYTRRANAYVFFYNHLQFTRAWYPSGQAPYEREDVWRAAPARFPEAGSTPAQLAQAFLRAYPPCAPLPRSLQGPGSP